MSVVRLTCTRQFFDNCLGSVDIDADELIESSEHSDPDLPAVIVPPNEDWIGDPESDGLICRMCATDDEMTPWEEVVE